MPAPLPNNIRTASSCPESRRARMTCAGPNGVILNQTRIHLYREAS